MDTYKKYLNEAALSGKTVSKEIEREFERLQDEIDDFMMHTEMVTRESGPDIERIMIGPWNALDKAYDNFVSRAKNFIKAAHKHTN